MAGHTGYFSSTAGTDYLQIITALNEIGAVEQASILTAATAAIRDAIARLPDKYLNRFLAGIEFADLTEFDDAAERCQRSIPACLLDYVARHENEFLE